MRQCRFVWDEKDAKAEELRTPPKSEELVVPPRRAKRHRAGRTAAGRTRAGAGVTRRTCVSEQAPERTLCRGVEAGSSSRTREYENDVHDSRRDEEMFE